MQGCNKFLFTRLEDQKNTFCFNSSINIWYFGLVRYFYKREKGRDGAMKDTNSTRTNKQLHKDLAFSKLMSIRIKYSTNSIKSGLVLLRIYNV